MFCMRFERIIHSVCTDFAPRKLLFVRHYTFISQNVVHVSESKGCAWVMRTWLRFASWDGKHNTEAQFITGAFHRKPEWKGHGQFHQQKEISSQRLTPTLNFIIHKIVLIINSLIEVSKNNFSCNIYDGLKDSLSNKSCGNCNSIK